MTIIFYRFIYYLAMFSPFNKKINSKTTWLISKRDFNFVLHLNYVCTVNSFTSCFLTFNFVYNINLSLWISLYHITHFVSWLLRCGSFVALSRFFNFCFVFFLKWLWLLLIFLYFHFPCFFPFITLLFIMFS